MVDGRPVREVNALEGVGTWRMEGQARLKVYQFKVYQLRV